jgi:phage tail sheath protein FI
LTEQIQSTFVQHLTQQCFYQYTNPADFIYPTEAVDNLDNTGIDSNYTATYYPWILVRDTVNNTQIYIPPTNEVCRNLALTDNISFPWFATAGYTRGLVNAVKARKKLTQEDRDTLYQGRINPIATFSDVGTVIWGNKTLQIADTALNRINVRRLLLQARKLISAVAVRLLFEQNDAQELDKTSWILLTLSWTQLEETEVLYDFPCNSK